MQFLRKRHIVIAAAATAAMTVFACTEQEVEQNGSNDLVPIQIIENMSALQSENGVLQSRMAAPRMERYENDSIAWELFPDGLNVYTYTSEGELESSIVSNGARHVTTSGKEEWAAYGNVIMLNHIKGDRMETDTVWWDVENKKIHTNCYVKMDSPDGFLQGFGMETDEKLANATILRPFDSDFRVISDTTKVFFDSLNFIGPLPR